MVGLLRLFRNSYEPCYSALCNKTNVGYGTYSDRLHCGVIHNVMMECMVNTMGNVVMFHPVNATQ